MMEEMYTKYDENYRSGDIGIHLLPETIWPVALPVPQLYQRIQDKVRARDYDGFSERTRASTTRNLKFAAECSCVKMALKMVSAEVLLISLLMTAILMTPGLPLGCLPVQHRPRE